VGRRAWAIRFSGAPTPGHWTGAPLVYGVHLATPLATRYLEDQRSPNCCVGLSHRTLSVQSGESSTASGSIRQH